MGRYAIAVSFAAVVCGCTRDNPLFGEGETDGTTSLSATGSASDPSIGSSQTTVDATGTDAGDSGPSDGTGDGFCGDDVVDAAEECDKGERNSNVGACKLDCTLNVCGDGFKGPREACDQPDDTNQMFCTHDCRFPTCGNMMLDEMEPCDPTADVGGGAPCTPICTFNECGDGFQVGIEKCDDGPANADTNACKADCTLNVCGDGALYDGVEECEGNSVPADVDCTDFGFFAGVLGCDPAICEVIPAGCHNCGNGTVDEGEQCDASAAGEPGEVAMPCGNVLGWTGMGYLSCDSCFLVAEGGCCKQDGQPCNADLGTDVFCCSQFCDDAAGTCGG